MYHVYTLVHHPGQEQELGFTFHCVLYYVLHTRTRLKLSTPTHTCSVPTIQICVIKFKIPEKVHGPPVPVQIINK